MSTNSQELEQVFSDDTYQLTGVAITKEGRLFSCYPLWPGPHRSSVKHDPSFTLIVDGKEFKKQGQPVHLQSDGIALTPDGEWLYYKPLTDNKFYRIQTDYLRDEAFSDNQREAAVEDLGRVAVTDGMIFDTNGNLYLGDYQNYKMVRITPEHKLEDVAADERLIWPDSYSISTDDYLYISCSQINKQPDYNEGENKRTTPYAIYRMKLPA